MFGASGTTWLFVQGALAAAGVAVWLRMVWRQVERAPQRRLLVEVWLPLAVLTPVLACMGQVHAAAHRGSAWMPLVGAVLVGMLGGAAALWRGAMPTGPGDRYVHSGFAGATWLMTGVMLLMLAAADVLTVLVGQTAFAIAAILLWINTPAVVAEVVDESTAASQRAATAGVMLMVLLGAAQGLAAAGAGADLALARSGIALGAAAIVVISAAARWRDGGGLRLAGWTASLGGLFGLGVLSVVHMAPFVVASVSPGDDEQAMMLGRVPQFEVAQGFAALSPEAAGLVALGLAAVAGDRLPRGARRAAAAMLAVVSACLLLWRLL